jgi:hypothetical protein
MEQKRVAVGRKRWSDRSIRSVFVGSVENETQEYFRGRFRDWESYIDVYECTNRFGAKQPYKYSVDEYIDLISSARFGVCFRGNGPKCFREMEYLAVGTPLIVTEGVDIEYPDPLIEGVHFLRAVKPTDISNIVTRTSADKWEEMSRACWAWFERNATSRAIFEHLKSSIDSINLESRRHFKIRVRATRAVAANSLAVRSLAIVDPKAEWICEDDPWSDALDVAPGEMFINELPLVGNETAYKWKVSPTEQSIYLESVLGSELPIHKALLELRGLRFRNFRVSVRKDGKDISLLSCFKDGGVILETNSHEAILRADFDWSRRCDLKYLDREIVISGPCLLERPKIIATMSWARGDVVFSEDVSAYFEDYFAINDCLMPPSELYRVCKLWQREGAADISIVGTIKTSEAIKKFRYREITWEHGFLEYLAE